MEVWTLLPSLFTHEKETRYPLNRTLVVPQRRSGRFGEEKNLFDLAGIQTLDFPAHILVTILTELSRIKLISTRI
jgi:hypothetical protein